MASSTTSSLFFFIFLVLFFTQINARAVESSNFGKVQRETNPTDQNPNTLVPDLTNEKKEIDDQNPAFIPQSENGYGLYGHETTYNNNNNEEKVNYDDSFSTPSLSETEQTQESYKNFRDSQARPSDNTYETLSSENFRADPEESYPKTTEIYDDNNNKDTSYNGNSYTYGRDKRVKEAYKGYNNKDTSYYENSNTYGTDKRENEPFNGYSKNVGRQGMSDTRYMANGNYYYDLDDDRNHGRYYQTNYYNYKPTGYGERRSNFKNPYGSNRESEMFGEEQGDQFNP